MRVAPATAEAPPSRLALSGTAALIRFALRRDRVRLPVWVSSIAFFTVWFSASLPQFYADAAERQVRADLMANPGIRGFTGPGYGLDDYTFGAMIAHEMLGFTAIAVAIMAILLMARHTRAEEESGQAELVRTMAVGRHAHTTAALVVVAVASLAIGLACAVGLGMTGLEGVTWPDSLLFGAALAAIGLVFAAVTAITVQVSQFARGSAGLAGSGFALAYFLRAIGDMAEVGGSAISWTSPIAWSQQTRVFVDGRWWPLVLSAALTVALVALAYRLSARRDVGGSLVPPRPGPPAASPRLTGATALAWRLQRTWVLWWAVALVLFGLGYGALTGEVERFVDEIDIMDEYLAEIGGAVIDAFLALLLLLLSLAVAAFAVASALRTWSEEASGRAESVLAAAVSRQGWLAGHVSVALLGGGALMIMSGLALGVTASAALGDPSVLARLLGASLAWVPAIWVTVGLAVALFGWAPRAVVLVWVLIGYAATVGMFGPILGVPGWALELSPFGHVSMLPAEPMRWVPVVVLTLVAAASIAAGLAGFRRRDLRTPA